MHLRPFIAAVTVAALSAPAWAEGPPLIPRPVAAGERLLSGGLPRALDGRLAFAYRVARNEGRPAKGEHWLLGRSVDREGLQVTVRFDAPVGEAQAAQLGRAGCVPSRLESGALASVGPVVTARCRWEGLWSAAAIPGVRFVSPTFGYRLHRPAVPPTDTTGVEVEAGALSAAFYPAGGAGKGVTVCDMDSGVDPFHPFFFRADGGAFAWIDVNGNQTFDPGTDAVDLNGNGQKDPDEVLRTVKSTMRWLDWYSGATRLFNQEPAFLPGYDWLYQDENGDGVRNSGRTAPYGDAKATFGEQLYLADDVNRDGQLGVGERVLRLLTPKIKAVRTPATPNGPSQVYRRGVNLAQTPEPSPGDYEHGAMVLGTIGGGVPNVTRFLGIAPEADLMLASTDSASLVNDLAWARAEGAQVVLWEMATWYTEFLDGSSGLEQACDAASDQGVLQLGAAGNLGTSMKHRVWSHAPGTESVSLVIPPGKTQYILGDFLWRGQAGGNFAFTLNLNGQAVPLSGSSGQADAGGVTVQWQRTQSTRQTQMLLFYLVAGSGTIAGQMATFDVVNSGASAPLHAYVTDSYTSWGKGVYWPTGATDRGTYGTPGVGDKTLSVATYFASLLPTGAPAGELAYYSGQGPRLDGADTVDFAAPEDHVTAYVAQGAGFGEMWIGGGTSNASPVAVGVAAILKGVSPQATSAELIAGLRANAQVEPGMGTVP
ncbi:MAG: S8 family serine peptidase, partial [Myxococcaceae bacterium]